jgi:hypothetical protein
VGNGKSNIPQAYASQVYISACTLQIGMCFTHGLRHGRVPVRCIPMIYAYGMYA